MPENPYSQMVSRQKEFVGNGLSSTFSFQIAVLGLLENAIKNKSDSLVTALQSDTGKSADWAYADEIAPVLAEIKWVKAHLRWWNLPWRSAMDSLISGLPRQRGRVPYGVSLIVASSDFPFRSAIFPCIAAIAGGNSVILRTDPQSSAVAKLVAELIVEYFTEDFFQVVEADNADLVDMIQAEPDLIFYSGLSAPNPQWLDLAKQLEIVFIQEKPGLNIAFIGKDTNLSQCAHVLAQAAFKHAGRDIRSPDLLIVEKHCYDRFLKFLQSEAQPYREKPEYHRIRNDADFLSVTRQIQAAPIIFGGDRDQSTQRVSPTIVEFDLLNLSTLTKTAMGPILRLATIDSIEQLSTLSPKPSQLGLGYLFGVSANSEKLLADTFDFQSIHRDEISDQWTRLWGRNGYSAFSLPQYKFS